MTNHASIDVPGVGELRIFARDSDIPAGWPRGRCWTNDELAALRDVAPTEEEARAIAECKAGISGRVISSCSGDRGPRLDLPSSLGMPQHAPTQRTKRFLERGHGLRPGPRNFRLGGPTS